MSKKVAVFRKEHFNAAHRLFNPDWDDAANEKVFGKCALPITMDIIMSLK